jgi:hypothetical protein
LSVRNVIRLIPQKSHTVASAGTCIFTLKGLRKSMYVKVSTAAKSNVLSTGIHIRHR